MDACTYCGLLANSVDHVVPRTMLKMAEGLSLDLSNVYRLQRWEVPACVECNTFIGSRVFKSLEERREYAHKTIRKKYAKYLRVPDWTDSELAKMGPIAQRDIASAIAKRDSVRARLAWRGSRHVEFDLGAFGAISDLAGQIVRAKAGGSR